MRGIVVVLVVLMVSATVAVAQPGNTPLGGGSVYGPAPTPPPPPPPVTGPLPGEKSPGIALSLSLGVTVGSYVLAVAGEETQSDGLSTVGALGIFLGPTVGHWYAGKGWTDGLTLRLAGLGAVMVGVILLLDCGFEGSCSDGEESPAAIVMVLGAGAYVGGTIYDIATAPGSARAYNARLRERAANGWALAPVVTGDRAGFVLSTRF
jgi:hypothetical protein